MRRLLFFLLLFPLATHAQKRGQAYIDSLLQQLSPTKEDTNKVKLLCDLSGGYSSVNPDEGIRYGQQGRTLADKLQWEKGKGLADMRLGENYEVKGDLQTALQCLNRAEIVFRKINNRKYVAHTIRLTGNVYEDLGNYSKATECHLEALKMDKDLGDKNGTATDLGNLANIYASQSDYPKALEYNLEALKIAEGDSNKFRLARILGNIGNVYRSIKDYKKAQEYNFKAMNMFQALGDKNNIAAAFGNIGSCYDDEKDYEKALEYFTKAVTLEEEMGNRDNEAVFLGNIGVVLSMQKKYPKAIAYIRKALEIDEKTGDINAMALALTQIGEAYLDLAADTAVTQVAKDMANALSTDKFVSVVPIPGSRRERIDLAISYLQRSLDTAKETRVPDQMQSCYEDLSRAYSLRGDYQQALECYKNAIIFRDSIFSKENDKRLMKAEMQYEYDKKQQIAAMKLQRQRNYTIMGIAGALVLLAFSFVMVRNNRLLGALNRQVTNQKAELERLNGVKDRIFSVISHDLRTPVNSLISFTQLLEHGNIPPEKLQKYSETLKTTLSHTAGLMENLLNWARTQMHGYKPVFEKFDVAETAKQTVGLLLPEADKKQVQMTNSIAADTVVFADMNMTSLLIRNLLSNAVKYTPNGGSINLSAYALEHKVYIAVRDTGVGIPQPLADNFNKSITDQPLDSTPGTNREKGTGLGLMLCKGFAALMNGKITLESEPGKGSCFTLELPT